MAYIYMSNGAVLDVPGTREQVVKELHEIGSDTADFQIEFPAGGAKQPRTVTISRAQVAVVSDQELPKQQ